MTATEDHTQIQAQTWAALAIQAHWRCDDATATAIGARVADLYTAGDLTWTGIEAAVIDAADAADENWTMGPHVSGPVADAIAVRLATHLGVIVAARDTR